MTDDAERMARAGNYVLGLMDDDERERAELDLERDGAFRDAVVIVADRLHIIDLGAGSEPVPDTLWRSIAQRIAELPQMRGAGATNEGPAADGRARTRPVVPTDAASKRRGMSLHALPTWRALALAASLAVACGIGYLAGSQMATTEPPVVVVVLNTPADVPGAVFEAYADDTVRIVPLENFAVPEGSTLQVWTLYDKEVGPVSLGTLPRATEAVLKGPHLPRPKAEQLYEITLEPAPGSPTGKPTGPILVKGFAKVPSKG